MNIKLVHFFIFAFLFGGMLSCKKENNTVTFSDLHTNYFDQTVGRYVIYEAEEILHDDLAGIHDTTRFWLKTKIGEEYIDNLGRSGRKFERFTSTNNGATWILKDVWASFVTSTQAELVEENQRVIKLVFAPSLSKEWDMNAYNSFDEQKVYYDKIHQPYSINSNSFDSTLTVIQADFFSLVDYKKQGEVYAKNVGLVKKYYKDLVIENFDTLQPKLGTEKSYNLLSYGIE